MAEAFPLSWPEHWPRSKRRANASFQSSLSSARDHLMNELRLMGAAYVVLSSNLALRQDGLPYASQRQPVDPGVAVYFQWNERQMVLACDCWNKVEDNLRAIGKTVDALRGIERWGASDMMGRAFSGFQALPPTGDAPLSCWDILGVPRGSSNEDIAAAYRHLAKTAHPDRGGTRAQWDTLKAAYDTAVMENNHG